MASRRSSAYGLLPSSSPMLETDAERLLAKERECDQLTDQLENLQRQLAGRPPKAELDNLRSEFRIQEGLLAGFQRENEKAEREVGRLRSYTRVLETELARLQGPTWAAALDLPLVSSTASSFGSPSVSLAPGAGNDWLTQSSPSTSRGHSTAAPHRRSKLGQETFTFPGSGGSPGVGAGDSEDEQNDPSDEDVVEADDGWTSSGDEVEGTIFSPVKKANPNRELRTGPRPPSTSSRPGTRSSPFGAAPSGLPSTTADTSFSTSAVTAASNLSAADEGKAVRRLLLGMEGRLSAREAELKALVEKAERQALTWRQFRHQHDRQQSAIVS